MYLLNRTLGLTGAILLIAGCQSDILFQRDRTGEIRRLHCGDDLAIAVPTTRNQRPLWSPDGRQLAYYGIGNAGPAIYVTDRFGRAVQNISAANVAVPNLDFVWSPAGDWIYYSARNSTGTHSIYRVQIDPIAAPQALTPLSLNSVQPSLTPDGRRFVYASDSPGNPEHYDLYTANADGTNRTLLTRTPAAGSLLPAWGPDGRIAYVRDRDVVLIEADGTQHVLGSYAGAGSIHRPDALAWSQDGAQLAFAGGGGKIHVAQTTPPYNSSCVSCDADVGQHVDETPRWMPGHARLVFGRPVGRLPPVGSPQGVFRIAADGTDEQLLISDGYRPDPRPRLKSLCLN